MILSTEVGALRAKTNERRAIEILVEAGFDALDYTFTPWMERGEMVWNGNEYRAYGKEVLQMAKDNGVYFNQAHAPFLFEIDGTPDWDKTIIPLRFDAWKRVHCWRFHTWLYIRFTIEPISKPKQ